MKAKLKKSLVCLIAALFLISSLPAAFAARLGSLNVNVTDESDAPVPNFKVVLCKVAKPDGVLLTAFAASGITPTSLLDEKNNADNAKALLPYAVAAGGNDDVTDAAGTAHFSGLDKGIYIIYSPAGQGCIFDPFLLYMPTMIGGTAHYDVVSAPKVEDEPTTPTPPPPPGGGDTPTPTPTPTPGDDPTPSPEPTDPVDPTVPPVEPTPPGGGGGGEGGDDPNAPGGGGGGEGGEDPGKPVLPLTGVERRPIWILLGLGSALIIAGVLQLSIRRKKA